MLVSFLKDRYAKPARFFGESFIVHGAIKGNLTVVFVDQRAGILKSGQKTLEWFGPDCGKGM